MTTQPELTVNAEPPPSTALATITGAISTIVAADKDDILGKLSEELKGFRSDATTPDGRKAIASKAKKVGIAKMDLIRLGKSLTEEWRKSTKAVNEECAVIEERMDAMRDQILAPLEAFKKREEDRVRAHEVAVDQIASAGALPPDATVAQINDLIADLAHLHAGRDWQEYEDRAIDIRQRSTTALLLAQRAAMKREADAAELERLRVEAAERQHQDDERRRVEREAEIARQAAEQARIEAEERAAEAAAQVKRDRQAEEDRAAKALLAEQERSRVAETQRVAAHQSAIRRILSRQTFPFPDPPAIVVQQRIDEMEAYDETDWQEFYKEAESAKAVVIEVLNEALVGAHAREEAAMLDEERKIEAAQAARQCAAEQQATAAREQAQRDADAAVERERQRVADEAMAAAKAQADREADKDIRAAANRTAAEDLVKAGLSDKDAKAAVTAIARGAVRGVRIEY